MSNAVAELNYIRARLKQSCKVDAQPDYVPSRILWNGEEYETETDKWGNVWAVHKGLIQLCYASYEVIEWQPNAKKDLQ